MTRSNRQRTEESTHRQLSVWIPAISSRDVRFDGRFFVGAATTKIYCRPICPVPFAKPTKLVWFAVAADAAAAGFRPCRRCRPDISPGSPAWTGTLAIVNRGLKLIWDGALDDGCVEGLANRLGIGSRQLRRLFFEHLGVSPLKIAIAHRVQSARRLIEETTLPITRIALSSGFTTIRQFNHAVRAVCGRTPTEMREARMGSPKSLPAGLVTRLRYRPPLAWDELITFLRLRAIPGVELVRDNAYQRTISLAGSAGVVDVRPDEKEPALTVRIDLPDFRNLSTVVERIRRIFDLEADPVRIAKDLSRDPRLKPLLDRRPGLRVPGAWDPFELAVRAISGEQLTKAGTNALLTRLVQTFGRPVQTSVPGLTHLFPEAQHLVDADLSKAGLHSECRTAIKHLARAVSDGQLALSGSKHLDAISRIREIRGISESTARYIAMRWLGEPDAFPLASTKSLSIADAWRPWRAYAAMHLCTGDTAK